MCVCVCGHAAVSTRWRCTAVPSRGYYPACGVGGTYPARLATDSSSGVGAGLPASAGGAGAAGLTPAPALALGSWGAASPPLPAAAARGVVRRRRRRALRRPIRGSGEAPPPLATIGVGLWLIRLRVRVAALSSGAGDELWLIWLRVRLEESGATPHRRVSVGYPDTTRARAPARPHRRLWDSDESGLPRGDDTRGMPDDGGSGGGDSGRDATRFRCRLTRGRGDRRGLGVRPREPGRRRCHTRHPSQHTHTDCQHNEVPERSRPRCMTCASSQATCDLGRTTPIAGHGHVRHWQASGANPTELLAAPMPLAGV